MNQVAQFALRELASGDDAAEMVAHLAQHVDRLPEALAARGIGRRPGLPGGGVIVLERLEGLLQELALEQRLGALAAVDRRLQLVPRLPGVRPLAHACHRPGSADVSSARMIACPRWRSRLMFSSSARSNCSMADSSCRRCASRSACADLAATPRR